MKINELLAKNEINVSCEVFPPKKLNADLGSIYSVVDSIADMGVDYISVTYGAGGSTSKNTVAIASHIQNEKNVTALAHLTCLSSGRKEIRAMLSELKANNIENILALRGDVPADGNISHDYSNAAELVADIKNFGGFCIGGACYPEGHPESISKDKDLDYLKAKAEAGCDFFTTQMFFDNNIFYNYLFRTMGRGIFTPIIPGIMPVTNSKQIDTIRKLSGTILPQRFTAIVDKFADDPEAMKQAGVCYACEQIIDLIANGVHAFHIYTMNKSDVTEQILSNLSCILKK